MSGYAKLIRKIYCPMQFSHRDRDEAREVAGAAGFTMFLWNGDIYATNPSGDEALNLDARIEDIEI